MPATSYTLIGPSSGVAGTASVNFTVTPDDLWTGTINIHTTGSGVFTPPVLTFVSSSLPQTFTYTPDSSISSPHFISVTATPPLGVDPGDLPYAVDPPPQVLRNRSPVLPQNILIRFIGKGCGLGPGSPAPSYYIKVINIADCSVEGSPTGYPGTKVFYDWAAARYASAGGAPVNQAALDALALQVARDYYRWAGVSFDQTFSGVLDPAMCGLYDEVEIEYGDDQCYTRLMTEPWAGGVENLMHWDIIDPAYCDLSESDNPFVYYVAPGIQCINGHIVYTVCKLHLFDGRLMSSYVRQDTV